MTMLTLDHAELESLTFSIGALAEQVQQLRSEVSELLLTTRATEQRWQPWDDFAGGMQPIVREGYALAVEELRRLEGEFDQEDVIRLMRRLLRNIRTFETLLSELESGQDLVQDLAPLTKGLMTGVTDAFALLESKGYVDFGRELLAIVDRVVTTYSAEEVRQLGDNVVLILDTIKAMTQPEIMTMMGNLTGTLRDLERQPQAPPPSLFALMRQLNDPDVRRGLALTLNVVKAVAPAGDSE
jgi:uncharacterized protein YjgD (DUF1641 family)